MGKGDNRRPSTVSREEENLRWLLYEKKITFAEYERKRKKLIAKGLWGPTGKLRY